MKRISNKEPLIKVGYLISYDYKYLFNSLPLVYPFADVIVLSLDKNRKTWSGNQFDIPELFFEQIKAFDTENKIKIYEDEFYLEGYDTPMELETRQRNLMSNFMQLGGWHLQIDVDEYPIDFKKIIDFLKSNKFLLKLKEYVCVNVLCEWITLYKYDEYGFYYVNPIVEKFYVATNNPNYNKARVVKGKNLVLNEYFIHQSWARSEAEIQQKVENWGHAKDFDTNLVLDNWKKLNKENYTEFINFHPLIPKTWTSVKFIEAKNIKEFIEKLSIESPKISFKLRKKLFKLRLQLLWFTFLKAIKK